MAPSFQHEVWNALWEIPYGETTSYGALAKALGHPGGARAVGLANGQNPIGLIVPCHRVIGADGSLTGYGGGLAAEEGAVGARSRAQPARGPASLDQPFGDACLRHAIERRRTLMRCAKRCSTKGTGTAEPHRPMRQRHPGQGASLPR